VRRNQSAPYVSKGFRGQLPIGDVDARTYEASKRTVKIESWHSGLEDPAVLCVVSPQSMLTRRIDGDQMPGCRYPGNSASLPDAHLLSSRSPALLRRTDR
jgi:hypothetical protein